MWHFQKDSKNKKYIYIYKLSKSLGTTVVHTGPETQVLGVVPNFVVQKFLYFTVAQRFDRKPNGMNSSDWLVFPCLFVLVSVLVYVLKVYLEAPTR